MTARHQVPEWRGSEADERGGLEEVAREVRRLVGAEVALDLETLEGGRRRLVIAGCVPRSFVYRGTNALGEPDFTLFYGVEANRADEVPARDPDVIARVVMRRLGRGHELRDDLEDDQPA